MEFKRLCSNNRYDEIVNVYIESFTATAGTSEGQLIGKLVQAIFHKTSEQDLSLFIAIEDNKIIGSIIFTALTFETPITAMLLSPVAIGSQFQRKGIGQNLINFGLNSLRNDGAAMVMTYGDPIYYSKFGFSWVSTAQVPSPFPLSQPEGWLALSLTDAVIPSNLGKSNSVTAFNVPDIW